jgi:hypothetical protein
MALAASLAGMAPPVQAQAPREARQDAARRDRELDARRQTEQTDKANQDAALADETSGASEGAQPARATHPNAGAGKPAAPSYGPVLNPRHPQSADPARKDPAEVRDETDSLARERPQAPAKAQQQKQTDKQRKQAQRRRQAWQPEGPMAPRPLSSGNTAAIGTGMVPVPPPAQAPQPVVPGTRALNSCIGNACTDAAGGTYNIGPNGVGVSSSGRLCSTSGTTVQCF